MTTLLEAAGIEFIGVCHHCQHRHHIVGTPETWLARMSEWEVKHRGHDVEFRSPRRSLDPHLTDRLVYPTLDVTGGEPPWWLAYEENADIKIAYASAADFTITLASLASSTTLVAGREGNAVDNTSNKYLDYMIGGKITTGTSPTASKTIQIRIAGSLDDGPTYPDVLDGTDSNETITSTDILNQIPTIAVLGTDATSNQTYYMSAKAVSLVFGGVLPKFFVPFVSHDTGVNLNGTGSNHKLTSTGIYATAV